MHPFEVDEMRPVDLQRIAAFQEEQENREWRRQAQLISYLMQPHMKKGRRLQPKEIAPWAFGIERAEPRPKMTKEEFRELHYRLGMGEHYERRIAAAKKRKQNGNPSES